MLIFPIVKLLIFKFNKYPKDIYSNISYSNNFDISIII